MGKLNENIVRKLVRFLFKSDDKQKLAFRKKVEKIKDKEVRDEVLDTLDQIEAGIEKDKEKWEKTTEKSMDRLRKKNPELADIWDF